MLLCSSRLAYPSIHELLMAQLLKAIVIPSHCDDVIGQVRQLLKASAVEIIIVHKEKFESTTLDAIHRHAIDLVFMISFSFKIPASLYQLPAKGFYNVHPGRLPAYRGPDPVFQQIKNREKKAGVCIHVVDEGYDTGDIIMQDQIRLHHTDTYGKLTNKLALLSVQCISVLIRLLMMGKQVQGRKQDADAAIYYKKQTAADVCVNWQMMTADEIVAMVNAGNPWNKGAITKLNETIVRIVEADSITTTSNSAALPGTVIAVNEQGLEIATLHGGSLRVRLLYTDDGFYSGTSLQNVGVKSGFMFSNF